MDQQHEAPVASSLPLQRSHHQRATAYPAMRLSKREMDENAQAKQEANEEWSGHGSALAARRRAGAGDGLTGGLTRLRFTSTTGRDGSTDASLTSPTLSSPSSQEVGDQNRKVFVGGIASHVTLAAVQEYFSQFGKVEHVMLMFDKSTQRHRGFGFVTFENEAVVDRVCNMHLHNIGGKMVECKRAQPKDDLVPVTLQRRPPNTPTGSALASAAALSAAASTMPFYGLGSLTGGGADAAGLGLGGRGGGAPFGGLPTAPTTEQMLAAYAAAASQFLPYSGASGGGGAASLYSQAGLLGGGGGGGMLPSPGYHAGLLSPSMTAAAAALAASGLYHLPGMGGGVPEAAYNPPATPSPINYQQALALEALYGLQNGAPPQSYFPYEF